MDSGAIWIACPPLAARSALIRVPASTGIASAFAGTIPPVGAGVGVDRGDVPPATLQERERDLQPAALDGVERAHEPVSCPLRRAVVITGRSSPEHSRSSHAVGTPFK